MGLFNFIETFFFISLGITFVLILLLVYHFKQRMSTLEQKGDTMFEIINNIVEELTSIKRELVKQTFNEKSFFSNIPSFSLSSIPNTSNVSEQKLEPVIEEENEDEVVDEASESESEDENEDEDESESEDEDESEGEDDNESEGEDDNESVMDEDAVVELDDSIEYDYDEGDEYEDDKDIKANKQDYYNSSDTVNEVNEELVEAEDVIFQEVLTENGDESVPPLEPIVQESEGVQESVKIVTLDLDESVSTEETKELDVIHTSEEVLDVCPTEEPDAEYSKEDMDAFKKMTIQQLKSIVLKKGLSTDVGKLKKNELIRILESSYE
jgi:hypothetical protein